MAILPRNLLKSFFEKGDKPNESQFGSLIDSMLHSSEDQAKLGLRAHDASRTYIAGEAVIYNGSLYQSLATTTGTFNPSMWQKIFSLGSVTYQGVWDADNNEPELQTGLGTKGDYYVVSVSGSTMLDGNDTWLAGDEAIFNGTSWERVINSDQDDQTAAEVTYNNATSSITATNVQAAIDEIDNRIATLDTSYIAEDASNLYYTDVRVAAAPAVTALESSVSAVQADIAEVDTRIDTLNTGNVAEDAATNLYYTDARVAAAPAITALQSSVSAVQADIAEVDNRIDTLNTGNITEDPATNLYYTDARVAAAPAVTALQSSVSAVQADIAEVDNRIDTLNTGNITEDAATNLYYTDARVAAAPAVTALQSSVSSLQTSVTALPWESYTSGTDETARLDSSSYVAVIPNTSSSTDLGLGTSRWRNLYMDGDISYSSSLGIQAGTSEVATFNSSGLRVGLGTGPHLSVDATAVAGVLHTINNNDAGASVIGNYMPGTTEGLSMVVTGSTYSGSGMRMSSRSALVSENRHLNIGTTGSHEIVLWTNDTARMKINPDGNIEHFTETVFYKRSYYSDGEIEGTEIDWRRGNAFFKLLAADATVTFSNLVNGQTIVVTVKQNATPTAANITWPADIKWPNGTVPTISTTYEKTDVFTFVRLNGVTYGNVVQNF